MSDIKEPIACRSVARWLYSFAKVVEGFAVSHALSGDERGEDRLNEHAREIQAIAQRLYDQKGIIRDSEYLVLLLQQAQPFIESSSFVPDLGAVFLHKNELLEAICRHAP